MMKARTPNTVQSKRSNKTVRKDQKLQKVNSDKKSSEQEKRKVLDSKEGSNVSTVASDSTTQSEASEVYETLNVHYLDDNDDVNGANKSSNAHQESDSCRVVEKMEKGHSLNGSVCEGAENCTEDVVKDVDVWEDASNGALSAGSENEAGEARENGGNFEDGLIKENQIENLEMRIEKLEEELREVAALEISLYSVVPDHVSSSHKLHTPARRISRLYIHACKHFTQGKRATIARNSVSGLILVARSCGNDVSRLTFWLSNTIALREIVSQTFGRSRIPSYSIQTSDSGKPTNLRYKNGFQQLLEDWQETETFTSALEKVEFWIFSRIVESVWWQVFTPHMHSPEHDSLTGETNEKLLGPALSDQKQGSFSISLWKNAFRDALQRLCPIRRAGHECGCLPVLARMVMEECIGRFDVAMFNAILRESEHQIPTDPISDPILDSKVLPIPAGDLSFGSGAQLKNSIGNWSRCLTEMFGMNSSDSLVKKERNSEDESESCDRKAFFLLNELSDLLMLPKEMLMENTIREEVCPSISLPLIRRILCNFTPDEFCPDHVPGAVLEELNSESIIEDEKLSGKSFPYAASPVCYISPSLVERVAGDMSENLCVMQRKGYTSDEELEELDSPLTSIIQKVSSLSLNRSAKEAINARYELLRQVWL